MMTLKKFRKGKLELPNTKKLNEYKCECGIPVYNANGTSGKASSISEERNTTYKNSHPTVKPTKLMRYLVKLVTPKGGIVLDPFMGSGSTGKACMIEGFNFIGIEKEKEYIKIARARINDAIPKQTRLIK